MSAIPPIGAGAPPITAAPPRVKQGESPSAASALWQVLTDEERDYFQSMSALGPVSYGPGGASSAPVQAPLGQRIDVTG